jgi:hypothetical protein
MRVSAIVTNQLPGLTASRPSRFVPIQEVQKCDISPAKRHHRDQGGTHQGFLQVKDALRPCSCRMETRSSVGHTGEEVSCLPSSLGLWE